MAAKVKIREARKEEMPAIREMTVNELRDELDEAERKDVDAMMKAAAQQMEAILKQEGNEFYVAEIEGRPGMAGYLWFGVSRRPFSGVMVGWVYDVQVVESERGNGVGEALMRFAIETSRKRGFESAGLMVRANNKAAYSLYEKLGFVPDHVLMIREDRGTVSGSNS